MANVQSLDNELRQRDHALIEERQAKERLEEKVKELQKTILQLSRYQIPDPQTRTSPLNNIDTLMSQMAPERQMTDNLQKRQTDDNFDGTESLGDHLIKCKYVTQSNGWTDKVESTASVSDVFQEQVGIKFAEMKDQLELRFQERHCAQTYYTRFMNRRQKPGEDFVTLATDLDRLSR